MSRGVLAVDRVATLLVALLLLAGGVGALYWAGVLPGGPDQLDLGTTPALAERAWWPWALGAAGVVLVLLGLRWLAAHLPDRGVARLVLPGSGREGRLLAGADAVADAASDELADTPGVRSAGGRVLRDRGQVVIHINATIEREADLALVTAGADRVAAQLRQVLGRDDLRCRVRIRVGRGERGVPRVS